jgi:hypothetical protein
MGALQIINEAIKGGKAASTGLKAADRAAAGRAAAELIKSQEQIKASEALGQLMEKGVKRTTTTQADRTRVGGGNIGGAPFSAISEADPNYAGKVWGVMDEGTAARLKNLTDPETAWTTMLGSASQLKTNPIVFDKLKRGFVDSMKAGNLSDELAAKINHNLGLTFGEGADIRDPSIWKQADTFDKRAALADLMMGKGIAPKKGGVALGGEKSGKGVIYRPSDILIRETERSLLHPEHGGEAPTFAAGPRLFRIDKESEFRPDLHPGFPTLLTGKDYNINMKPTPTEAYLPDWHREFKKNNPDRKAPGYYDLALGVKGEGLPSQELNDEYIRHLLREGFAEGGVVHADFHDKLDSMIQAHMADGGGDFDSRLESMIKDHHNTLPDMEPAQEAPIANVTAHKQHMGNQDISRTGVSAGINLGDMGRVGGGMNMTNVMTGKDAQLMKELMAYYSNNIGNANINANLIKPMGGNNTLMNLMGSMPVGEGRVSMGLHGSNQDGRNQLNARSVGYQTPMGGGHFNANINSPVHGSPSANVNFTKQFADGGDVHMGVGGLLNKAIKAVKGAQEVLPAAEREANLVSKRLIADNAPTAPKTVSAGDIVNGMMVRKDIPNQSSIGASLYDYSTHGIQEVPMSAFETVGKPKYRSVQEEKRTKELARQIQENKELNPLIVVKDAEGHYILEGGHRFDALRELGIDSFPALMVHDLESLAKQLPDASVAKAHGGLAHFAAGGSSRRKADVTEALTEGLAPMLYGGAKGALASLLGFPGELEQLGRTGINFSFGSGPGHRGIDVGEEPFLPNTKRVSGALPNYRGSKVANEVAEMGTDLGENIVGTMLDPLAVIKGAKPVLEAAKMLTGSRGTPATAQAQRGVIKMPGGNWLNNSVENSLKGLRRNVSSENLANYTPEQVAQLTASGRLAKNDALNNWVDRNLTNYVKKQMATPDDPVRKLADQGITHKRDFLDQEDIHLDGTLKRERKEAGFPEQGMAQSPLGRAWDRAADESLQLYKAGDIQSAPEKFAKMQEAQFKMIDARDALDKKFLEYAKSKGMSEAEANTVAKGMPYDKKAELIGDTDLTKANVEYMALNSPMVESYRRMNKENPWIGKVDPKSPVYSSFTNDLGFDHIMDVLREDVASGRIRPEQLNKVSMEQAVRRVHEYDQEMARKMAEAQAKVTEGMPIHKDYPDKGYKWIELTKPEVATELPSTHAVEPYQSKGELGQLHRVINTETGMRGEGYATPERAIKEFNKSHAEERLGDALKYEGDTMGHCVGGYCPDVLEGRSRIYSLRDTKGEPHVTIEVQPNQHLDYNDWYNQQPTSYKALLNAKKSEPGYDRYQEPAYLAAREALPPRIVQIKGKQNAAPKEDYLPYVQDFVKSGQWSDVGDLHNTGLYKINKDFLGDLSQFKPSGHDLEMLTRPEREEALIKAIEAKDLPESGYATRDEWEKALRTHRQPPTPGPTMEFLREMAGMPPEGMKRGGAACGCDLNAQYKRFKKGGSSCGCGGAPLEQQYKKLRK